MLKEIYFRLILGGNEKGGWCKVNQRFSAVRKATVV
jgi:hypothetical protein